MDGYMDLRLYGYYAIVMEDFLKAESIRIEMTVNDSYVYDALTDDEYSQLFDHKEEIKFKLKNLFELRTIKSMICVYQKEEIIRRLNYWRDQAPNDQDKLFIITCQTLLSDPELRYKAKSLQNNGQIIYSSLEGIDLGDFHRKNIAFNLNKREEILALKIYRAIDSTHNLNNKDFYISTKTQNIINNKFKKEKPEESLNTAAQKSQDIPIITMTNTTKEEETNQSSHARDIKSTEDTDNSRVPKKTLCQYNITQEDQEHRLKKVWKLNLSQDITYYNYESDNQMRDDEEPTKEYKRPLTPNFRYRKKDSN